jgi:dipeptidyl aminopeptidase/acylaminoacyl peptidase
MSKKTTRQHGLWDSPISPGALALDRRLGDVQWDRRGSSLAWTEGRSGAGVVMAIEDDGAAPREITGDLNVRAEVGYGGGDFTIDRGVIYFAVHKSGRIFRRPVSGGQPRPIIPASGKAASPAVSPDGRFVVFVHHDAERVDRLGIVDADGGRWPAILAEGRDFYMQPAWSPDGRHLAWIAWDHPRMPWDGAGLYVAPVLHDGAGGTGLPRLGEARRLAGGDEIAVFQPEFTADGKSMVYASDETGWSQLWIHDLAGGARRCLTGGDAEYGLPAWGQGTRSFALLADGRSAVAARAEKGFVRLEAIDLRSGERQAIPELAEYTEASQLSAAPSGRRFAFVGSASGIPPRVVVFDLERRAARIVARSSGETVDAASLSTPEPLSWPSFDGGAAHGLFFPPASARFEGSGRPPLLVLVHGGPTGQVRAAWNAQAQFFATRGYAVLAVNYRGSTGYGRDYMLALRGSWGIHDVEDSVSGKEHLARLGRVDGERAAIFGGSAGGFTVLHAMVTRPQAFAAGVCLYGVANQFTLVAETHKFEERYSDSLLGPLPEASAVYRERSPVFHAEKIVRPLAIFQGEIDQVVPRSQSDAIVEALRRRGTPHVYHVYAEEGHGWRKRETIEHFYRSVEEFLRQHLIYA